MRSKRVLAAPFLAVAALIAAAPAAADWTAPVELSDSGTRDAENLQIDAGPGRVAAWNYGSGVAVVLPSAGGGPAPQTYAGSYGAPTVGIGGEGVGAIAFPLTTYGIVAASKPAAAGTFGEATQIEGPPNEDGMKGPILAVNDLGTAQLFHGIEDQTFGFGSKFTGRDSDRIRPPTPGRAAKTSAPVSRSPKTPPSPRRRTDPPCCCSSRTTALPSAKSSPR